MKSYVAIIILLLISVCSKGQDFSVALSETDFSIGKTIKLKSKILKEVRTLNIYLPPDYSKDSLENYPVIYLLDGSADEDFIHVAGLVQFLTFPWIGKMPESLVVGIANTDRKKDFTPPSDNILDQQEFPTSGKAAEFISFIENELQPFINSTYRTTDQKTLIGQSLGGLLATLVLHEKPTLFDNYIIVSPSLWWNDEKLLKKPIDKDISEKSVYVAVGKEGEVMERTARSLYDKLIDAETDRNNIYFDFMHDKTHGDALHMAVYRALGLIFDKGK